MSLIDCLVAQDFLHVPLLPAHDDLMVKKLVDKGPD